MITQESLKKTARLAKLRFNDHDIKLYTAQLGSIMDMIERLQEVDTNGIEPLSSVHEMSMWMRDDIVTEENLDSTLFLNLPGKDASFAKEIKCFIVPKVVE